jgi:Type II secretory pathway, ATPase PulE/Tfp pilus assembly pathway, ATPase PilB
VPTSSTTAGSASPGAGLTGLPRRLVEDRLLDETRARTALTRAAQEGRSFINVVVTEKWLTAARLAELASGEFGMPLVDLGAVEPEPELLKGLSERLLVGQHALPLMRRGRRLYIALSDPTNLQALDEFKFASGLATEGILVEDDKLGRAIEVATTTLQSARLGMDEAELDRLEVAADPATTFDENARTESDDAPMVRFVHKILLDAIQRGASDVHFEPYEHRYRVRYRLDGVLKEIASPPPSMGVRIAARLKVMARLDLAERRVPQDGRIKLQISRSKAIDFRVNTLPTMWGEKIVCRILDVSSAMMGIDALGFEPEQRALYQRR